MKRYLKLLAAAALALLLSLSPILLSGCSYNTKPVVKTGFYFNTVVILTCYGNQAEEILDQAMQLCSRYEKLFSRTVKNSDIWKINHARGASVTVDAKTALVLRKALEYAQLTEGKIDPTVTPLSELWNFSGDPPGPVPDASAIEALLPHVDYRNIRIDGASVRLMDPEAEVDLGFIAKGYIADALKAFFLEKGVKSALINLGGNVLAVGEKPDGSPFYTGVKKPFGEAKETLAIVELRDRSLVSSGSYERCFEQDDVLYHHILDPSTGYPADTGLSGVTILSSSSMEGDALSTACFLLGLEEGRELIESLPDTEALFVTDDGSVYKTSGFLD